MPDGPRLVIGISGPICVGKTTAAKYLEGRGFSYARFSMVIDEEIAELGLPHDRQTRQRIGWEIHQSRGQRYLADRIAARVAAAELAVVDGLRFMEDRALLATRFGSSFTHLHILAERSLRLTRFEKLGGLEEAFSVMEAAPVESEVGKLCGPADHQITNGSTLSELYSAVLCVAEQGGG